MSKRDLLEVTLYDLDPQLYPDVLCLTETFIRTGHEGNLIIANFRLGSSFGRNKSRGGSCILVRQGIDFEGLHIFDEMATVHSFECAAVEIPFLNMIVICLYRTPSKKLCDVNDFFNRFLKMLHKLSMKYPRKKIVITGDLNINTLSGDSVSMEFQDILKNYNYHLHITESTRGTSCIDHIISNLKNATGMVLPLHLSDHNTAQILKIPFKNKSPIIQNYFICKRDYSLDNIRKFKEYLKSLSFKVNDENILEWDTVFTQFHGWFCLLYGLCFPEVKIKVNNKSHTKWISKGLRISCKTKRLLRFRYYKHKTSEAKDKYQAYSKLLKKCIYKSKKNVNSKYITNSKNVCKATWQLIQQETGGTLAQSHIDRIEYNNNLITEPSDIASIFNEYFINLTNRLHTDIKITNSRTIINNSIYLNPINENDIKKEIMTLNNTNAVGPDGISTKILKACRDEVAPILAYFINQSLVTGKFPDVLKFAVVKPLFKKGDKAKIENYRPITLISIFSKIFEKVFYRQVMGFFNKYSVLRANQYGFQKQKCTTLATFNLVRHILQSTNDNLLTTVVLFDMSRAFDFVHHSLLLSKLEQNGIRGPALSWIASYLDDRRQCVQITKFQPNQLTHEYKSSFVANGFGVPQGSVLGPLLFLVYINDLPQFASHRTILFADDISLVVSSKKDANIHEHEMDINSSMNIIIKWLTDNNLNINIDKTYYLNYNNIKNQLNIKHNGLSIKNTECAKFLGIYLDNKLKWKEHVGSICKRINRFCYPLHRLTKMAPRSTALTAYFGHIQSIIKYGLLIWGNSTDIGKVFVAQKKCIRAICGAGPMETCRPLFKELRVLPLPCLYIMEVARFVKDHWSLFKKQSDMCMRTLRYPNRLVTDVVPRSTRYKRNCIYMCITVYNKIPESIKMLSGNQFRKVLYNWLTNKNYYSINDFLHDRDIGI